MSRTIWHVYLHDQGCVDWCEAFSTRGEALDWIRRTQDDMARHAAFYRHLADPYFTIVQSAERDPAQDAVLCDQWAAAGGDLW